MRGSFIVCFYCDLYIILLQLVADSGFYQMTGRGYGQQVLNLVYINNSFHVEVDPTNFSKGLGAKIFFGV